ncbi:MAG TPA: hypothetical protein VMY18_02820 [Acidobacteriota bacterium]|nr:hypothetical protein [Acidobacteriota bacterium]
MKYYRACLIILTLLNVSYQQVLSAQPVSNHVVPVEDLQNRLITQSTRRMENIQEVQKLLRHDLVQKQLGQLVDLERAQVALATLDDETLNQLANESRRVNDQLQAGMATWGWVVIAVIAAGTIIAVVGATTIGKWHKWHRGSRR